MNLPVIISKIGMAAKNLARNGWFLTKKHAPEILIGGGIAGIGLTVYETAKATNKSRDILDHRENALANLEWQKGIRIENHEDTSRLDKSIREEKRNSRWALFRAWAPVATSGGASVIFILSGYKIINGRYVGAVAAYKALESGFERYRENVTEEFGEETDWRMLNSVKPEDMEKARKEQHTNREIDTDNKHRKFNKKPKQTQYADIYNRIFDENSARWQRYWTPSLVFDYLNNVQDQLNDKLRLQGHLFVNEVYDRLDFERTPEGQITGWIWSKDHPSEVDFGFKDIPADKLREILGITRNSDIRIPINLKPEGIIYNIIDETGEGFKEKVKRLCQ